MKQIFINIIFLVLVFYLFQSYLGKIGDQYGWMGLRDVISAYKNDYIAIDADKMETNGKLIKQNSEKFISNKTTNDFFIYGNYTEIFQGKYWFSIQGIAFQKGKVAHIQISSNKGEKILFQKDIWDNGFPIQKKIELPTAKNVEVRIASFTDEDGLMINKVELRRLDAQISKFVFQLDNALIQRLKEFKKLKAYQ